MSNFPKNIESSFSLYDNGDVIKNIVEKLNELIALSGGGGGGEGLNLEITQQNINTNLYNAFLFLNNINFEITKVTSYRDAGFVFDIPALGEVIVNSVHLQTRFLVEITTTGGVAEIDFAVNNDAGLTTFINTYMYSSEDGSKNTSLIGLGSYYRNARELGFKRQVRIRNTSMSTIRVGYSFDNHN